jgi:hypothetical protein
LRGVYASMMYESAARMMNRRRVIGVGPRVPIPQQVPVYGLRCEKPGCQSKNRTKRRCVNHCQTPCCSRCNVCNVCEVAM